MRAAIARAPGGPEVLEVVERPDPRPGADDLLVRVRSAGINRADVLQRQGRYPPPKGASDVLGLELAGEVVGMGAAVNGWRAGDEVCAVVPAGGCAELVLVPAPTAMPLPPDVRVEDAGAIPEVFTTAWDNVVRRGRLDPGESLLVHGGSSGVGTAAVQLAARRGCRVLVTASTEAKIAACRRLGAEAGIDYRAREDFDVAVRGLTDGRGVDVVLDIVGGPYLERNLACLSADGRLVVIGLQGGARAELDLGLLLPRRLTITASTLRARTVAERAPLAREMVDEVWPGFADGSLRPVIAARFPLEEIAEAHRLLESSAHIGKVLLDV